MATKKVKRKKKPARTPKKKKAAPKKAASRKTSPRSRRKQSSGGRGKEPGARARIHQGVALAEQAGQSGDVQGLSAVEDVDSESVAELAEEGQAFEAGIVNAVENAPDADQGGIRTEEVPEDDVPAEYRNVRERED